jgi:hypothetical protein
MGWQLGQMLGQQKDFLYLVVVQDTHRQSHHMGHNTGP